MLDHICTQIFVSIIIRGSELVVHTPHTCAVHVFCLPGKELMEQQSKVEDVECLPTLTVNDIERCTEPERFIIQHKGRMDC